LSLSNSDKEKTIKRYHERFELHGHDQKSVGWGEKGRQRERFNILLNILKIDNFKKIKVADIGAGFGDLYKFLIDQKIPVDQYYGYEIVPNLVKQGNLKYKNNTNFNLFNCDYLEKKEIENVDISLISGSLNFKLIEDDNFEYIENVLKKAFVNSEYGVAANFITDRTDFKDELIFYANPEKILEICYKLTKRFLIDHSYFPFEYSIALFKKDSYNKKMPTFDDPRLKI